VHRDILRSSARRWTPAILGSLFFLRRPTAPQAFEMGVHYRPDAARCAFPRKVGCALDCSFSGHRPEGLNRNMSTAEMVGPGCGGGGELEREEQTTRERSGTAAGGERTRR